MLRVIGIKISKSAKSTKVLYEKKGKHYIRSGNDDFSKGEPIRQHVSSYFTKWGFRPIVDGDATFRDGQELYENIDKFQVAPDYKAKYYG
jgi:hypothetical protein